MIATRIRAGLAIVTLLLAVHVQAQGAYDGLVINEILPNPRNAAGAYVDANQDSITNVFDDEFIELLNTSTVSIDVTGMLLTDANTNLRRHVFSARILPPGGALVVFGGGSLLSFSNPPAQIASSGGLSLNNDTDTLSLFSPLTTLVVQATYQLTATHDAISTVRRPDGTGGFTNHYQATTNNLRASPGRQVHGLPFLTNQPPVFVDMPGQTAFVGLELQFPVRAFDPADRDPITLSVLNPPANSMLTATGSVGTFTFTPAPEQAGQSYPVEFMAADTNGATTNLVTIQVVNPNVAGEIWINEFHYDNEGVDADEGVEIAGTAGSVLTNYALVFYNGNDGRVYDGTNWLTGTLDDEQCGYGAAWFPHNGIQNDTDGIALIQGSNVVQFLSYEGVLTASNGPAFGLTSVDIGFRENAVTVGHSLQLAGTGTAYSAFAWTNARPHTRGALNTGQGISCFVPASIEIRKTVYLGHDGGAGAPGAESVQATNGAPLTYVFVVTNTGASTVTNTLITDDAISMAPVSLGTLLAGETRTAHVETVASGDLRNTATVSGYGADGAPVSASDSAEVVEIIPGVDVQLTLYRGHDGGAACPGGAALMATNGTPVTFCLAVANTGSTNLTDLVLNAASLGLGPLAIGTLAAGGTFTTSLAATVTATVTHVATITGNDPNSDPVNDQDAATVTQIAPAIGLEKTVYLGHDGGAACPGSAALMGTNGTPITYCFTVTNAGDTTLTNVVLADPNLPGFAPAPLATLATGAAWTVYFETTIGGNLTNTAQVTGFAPEGTPATAMDTATVTQIAPAIGLEKTVYRGHDGGAACPGGANLAGTNGTPVTYCFTVTNSGDVALTNVVLADPNLPGFAPAPLATLATGTAWSVYFETLIGGNLTNTAYVTGFAPEGTPATAEDTAMVAAFAPGLGVQFSVYRGHDGGAACPGETFLQATNQTPVTFCLVVTNTGDAALTAIVARANSLGQPAIPVGILAPGGVFATAITAVVTGSLAHVASADGLDVNGGLWTAAASATVQRITASVQLQKTVYLGHDGGAACPGGENVMETNGAPLTYCFLVTNAGDTVLTNLVLTDSALPGFPPTPLGSLNPGQAASFYFETTLSGSRVNSATVTATTVLGDLLAVADTASVTRWTPPNPGYVGEYSVIDLGTLGGDRSAALGLNDRGQVVGWSIDASNRTQAFVWQHGVMTGLGFFPGGTSSVATAINNNGEITGWATAAPSITNAFRYADGQLINLGTLGGPGSWGRSINLRAEIAGVTQLASNSPLNTDPESCVWRTNGVVHITPYHNYSSCEAYGINDAGWVCGITFLWAANERWWGYVWRDSNNDGLYHLSEMQVLGSLGVNLSSGSYSGAMAINRSGVVVGWTSTTNTFYPFHAFLVAPSNNQWKIPAGPSDAANALMRDLGVIGGPANNSMAKGINDHNWVVGFGDHPSGTNQAFLWRNGVITNLNFLIDSRSGWTLTDAAGINYHNEIAGTGLHQGQSRAVLLRREGRITAIDSVLVPADSWTWTNEFNEVITQQAFRVATQVLQWGGTWRPDSETTNWFTLEYCDALQHHVWLPVQPGDTWPTTVNVWTNPAFDTPVKRFYRIRAH